MRVLSQSLAHAQQLFSPPNISAEGLHFSAFHFYLQLKIPHSAKFLRHIKFVLFADPLTTKIKHVKNVHMYTCTQPREQITVGSNPT